MAPKQVAHAAGSAFSSNRERPEHYSHTHQAILDSEKSIVCCPSHVQTLLAAIKQEISHQVLEGFMLSFAFLEDDLTRHCACFIQI
jgi:hypothetical protein